MITAGKQALKMLLSSDKGRKLIKALLLIVLSVVFIIIIIPVALMETINPFNNVNGINEEGRENRRDDPYALALIEIQEEMNQANIIVNLDLIKTLEAFVVFEDNPSAMNEISVSQAKEHLKRYYLNLEEIEVVEVIEEEQDINDTQNSTIVRAYKGKDIEGVYSALSLDYPQVLSDSKKTEVLSILDLVKTISRKTINGNQSMPIETGCYIYAQPYGQYLEGGEHYGVDLATEKGTPIYAVADGKITAYVNEHEDSPIGLDMESARHYHGKENYVTIEHKGSDFNGNNIHTRYMHNSLIMNPLFEIGDEVKAGNIIGFVGNSGFSTGYHLHFEVWEDGSRIDPLNYFNFGSLQDISFKTKSCVV